MFDYGMTASPQIRRMGKTNFVGVFECTEIYFFVSLMQLEIMIIFFTKKKNCTSRHGLSTLQKVTTVFRIMEFGASTDSNDEYVRIGESTTILRMKRFCRAIVEIFCKVYLRSPNANYIEKLLSKSEEHGFPSMS